MPAASATADDCLSRLPPTLATALMPFQRDGVRYGWNHEGRVLLGDEMGLGKTIQAIAIAALYRAEWPCLIIVPASLKYAWADELERWLPFLRPGDVHLVQGRKDYALLKTSPITIVTYGCLRNDSPVTKAATAQGFKVIVVDESHYLKNHKARRTEVVAPMIQGAKRAILLSGTPALARPVELYTQASSLAPSLFGTYTAYTKQFCNAHRGRFGWDVSGASNSEELHALLKSIMIRRLKRDVLTQLPPKRRQRVVIEVSAKAAAGVRKTLAQLRAVGRKLDEQHGTGGRASPAENKLRFERLRLLSAAFPHTAEAKRGAVTEYLNGLFLGLDATSTSGGGGGGSGAARRGRGRPSKKARRQSSSSSNHAASGKVLVFAHHLASLDAIEQCVVRCKVKPKIGHMRIDGSTPLSERHRNVQRFQTDPSCRVAVLSMTAAGTGLTLTAATTVVFAELHWTPGVLKQCEDRAHRIGQASAVNIIYLCAKDTMDEVLWALVGKKLRTLGTILDGDLAASSSSSQEKNANNGAADANTPTDGKTGSRRKRARGMDAKTVHVRRGSQEDDDDDSPSGSPSTSEANSTGVASESTTTTKTKDAATPGSANDKKVVGSLAWFFAKKDATKKNTTGSGAALETSSSSSSSSSSSLANATWECPRCTFLNSMSSSSCKMCLSARPGRAAASRGKGKGKGKGKGVPVTPSSASSSASLGSGGTKTPALLRSSGRKKKARLHFAVSKSSGRVFLYDASKSYLNASISCDNIANADLRALATGQLSPEALAALPEPLRDADSLLEAREFVRQWRDLRAVERSRLGNVIVQPPLAILAAQASSRALRRAGMADNGTQLTLSFQRYSKKPGSENQNQGPASASDSSSSSSSRPSSSSLSSSLGSGSSAAATAAQADADVEQVGPRETCLRCGERLDLGRAGVDAGWEKNFCSFECSDNHSTRISSSAIRRHVFELEHGVCQLCGVDAHALYQRVKALAAPERIAVLADWHGFRLPKSALNKPKAGGNGTGIVHNPTEGHFWQVDHIVAVAEGGGECALDNLRTLCTPCHSKETRALHRRLRDRRLKEEAGLGKAADIRSWFAKGSQRNVGAPPSVQSSAGRLFSQSSTTSSTSTSTTRSVISLVSDEEEMEEPEQGEEQGQGQEEQDKAAAREEETEEGGIEDSYTRLCAMLRRYLSHKRQAKCDPQSVSEMALRLLQRHGDATRAAAHLAETMARSKSTTTAAPSFSSAAAAPPPPPSKKQKMTRGGEGARKGCAHEYVDTREQGQDSPPRPARRAPPPAHPSSSVAAALTTRSPNNEGASGAAAAAPKVRKQRRKKRKWR